MDLRFHIHFFNNMKLISLQGRGKGKWCYYQELQRTQESYEVSSWAVMQWFLILNSNIKSCFHIIENIDYSFHNRSKFL